MEPLVILGVVVVIGSLLVSSAVLRRRFPVRYAAWMRRHKRLVGIVVPFLVMGAATWAATQSLSGAEKAALGAAAASVLTSLLLRYMPPRSARPLRWDPATAIPPDATSGNHVRRAP